MPLTFDIGRVERGGPGRYANINAQKAIKSLVASETEAADANLPTLIAPQPTQWADSFKTNGFLTAVHHAFANHYPLVLSPDDVWLAISQGFAAHINNNAEKLRHKFVSHEGKEYIEIRRDGFVKGSPNNDWPGAFSEFSDRLAEYIGKSRDLIVGRFATTGPVERAASEIVLMDAMQSYFEYGVRTCCGIPELTLLGTADDWSNIRERARALAEYDCEDWSKSLGSVLDHFVAAHVGNADPKFWSSFYKLGGGSGGPYVTGAINVFFPYLVEYNGKQRTNKASLEWNRQLGYMGGGPTTDMFPSGLGRVPFKWIYGADEFKMNFIGGFVGASQDPTTLALRPSIGWGISDQKTAS